MEKLQSKGKVFKPTCLKQTSGEEVGGTRDQSREDGAGIRTGKGDPRSGWWPCGETRAALSLGKRKRKTVLTFRG